MKVKHFTFIFLFSIHLAAFANTQAIYPFTSQEKAQRFQTLIHNVRCVVCQNENIADSGAPIAKDLRLKVYQLVQANQSETQIENYLVKRYGEFILLNPRFNKFTVILWGLPIIIFILFAVLFVRNYRTH
jgi:cytochrome c-type biogenesis protein CcmH